MPFIYIAELTAEPNFCIYAKGGKTCMWLLGNIVGDILTVEVIRIADRDRKHNIGLLTASYSYIYFPLNGLHWLTQYFLPQEY